MTIEVTYQPETVVAGKGWFMKFDNNNERVFGTKMFFDDADPFKTHFDEGDGLDEPLDNDLD